MNTQQLWQAQALDAPRISLAFVLHQTEALRRQTQRHKVAKSVVGAVGLAYLALRLGQTFGVQPLRSSAMALWVAAGLTGAFLARNRMAWERRPAEFGVLDALKFQRRQLERQRDARRGGWRWLSMLFYPGHVLLFASLFVEVTPVPWNGIVFCAVVIVASTWIGLLMTERSARRIQKEIDALDSL